MDMYIYTLSTSAAIDSMTKKNRKAGTAAGENERK
jgi:hypothetical protein